MPMAGADGSDPGDGEKSAGGDSWEVIYGEGKAAGATAPAPEEAVYCSTCQIWLNGPSQFKAHLKKSLHRKCLEVESCSLDMSEDVAQYSGSLSNLCRECPD